VKDFDPHRFRKDKAGQAMPRRPIPPEVLQEIRDLAAGWGKIVAKRAFGESGPGLDVDFDTMEQIALAAALGLTEGTLSTSLQQQARALDEDQPCPACGSPCPVRRQPRTLATPGATVTHDEPACHCPACRRDFFPPKAPAAPG
jgi:hypothetical protein